MLFPQLHSIRHEQSTMWEQLCSWNTRLTKRLAKLNWKIFSIQTIVGNFAVAPLYTWIHTGSCTALPVVLRVENGRDSEVHWKQHYESNFPAFPCIAYSCVKAAEILCSWAPHGKSCSEHKSGNIANILNAELLLLKCNATIILAVQFTASSWQRAEFTKEKLIPKLIAIKYSYVTLWKKILQNPERLMLTIHNKVLLMLLSNIYNEYSKHQEERFGGGGGNLPTS